MENTYRASHTPESQRKRQHRAVLIAVCTGCAAAACIVWATILWDKPRAWVPILGGFAVAIIVYGLLAPES